MKKIALVCILSIAIISGAGISAYCATLTIRDLVDGFAKATDLQRQAILGEDLGKEISAGGTVANAGEYDFFDTVDDIRGSYFQITTLQQKTTNNVPYQVFFLSKDKDKALNVDRRQAIQRDGKIIRIEDERLQIAVWIFCGDMSEKDKALFKKDQVFNN